MDMQMLKMLITLTLSILDIFPAMFIKSASLSKICFIKMKEVVPTMKMKNT